MGALMSGSMMGLVPSFAYAFSPERVQCSILPLLRCTTQPGTGRDLPCISAHGGASAFDTAARSDFRGAGAWLAKIAETERYAQADLLFRATAQADSSASRNM